MRRWGNPYSLVRQGKTRVEEENTAPSRCVEFKWEPEFPWPSIRGARVTGSLLSRSKMGTNPPKDGKSRVYGECSLGFMTYTGLLNRHDLKNMRGPS